MQGLVFALVCLVTSPLTQAYPRYQEELPNGNNVDHPCKVNYRWPGLGHENPLGGGSRNPFGQDFERLGRTWNTALCMADSDGDGLTNGQELGDPNCTWQPGQIPNTVTGLSHPGVCEPHDSDLCRDRNAFLDCEVETFQDCSNINRPGVLSQSLTFPSTPVPNTETNYYCMTFDLPSDQDYHLVAYEPLIDNEHVLHHILLYGCPNNSAPINQPQACGMSGEGNSCDELIGLWAVGMTGFCFPENLGFRIGLNGYRRVRLETHWNNPELRADYTDGSGLKLYMQPSTPQFTDLMTFWTGQMLLEIPPGQARIEEVSTCPGECTKQILTKPAYIINAINHMHYLGRAMKIQIFRNGQLYKDVTNEDYYSYDNPIEHIHNPPIELLPGDEIKTTCVFNSLSKDRWVFWGDGTSDEMCFGFLTIYPADAFNNDGRCIGYGPVDACSLENRTPINGCDWANFINKDDPETAKWMEELKTNCNVNGYCRPECRETVDRIRRSPCLQGEMESFTNTALTSFTGYGIEIMARMNSCPAQSAVDCSRQCAKECGGWSDGVTDGASGTSVAILTTSFALVAVRVFGHY